MIQLQYVWHIGQPTQHALEQCLWHDAWTEFTLQCQRYDNGGQWHTLDQMIAADGKSHSLHYKVGFAIGGYVQQWQHQIPGLHDKTGQMPLPFERWELRIMHADLQHPDSFRFALLFDTPVFSLHGIIGTQLVLSATQAPNTHSEDIHTFMVDMQGPLTISRLLPGADLHNKTNLQPCLATL